MARISSTPPGTPFFSSSSSAPKPTSSSRSGGGGGGGSGFTLVHSINSLWAKLTRAAKKKMSTTTDSSKPSPVKPRGPKHLLLTLSNKGSNSKQKKKQGPTHDHHEFVDEEVDFGDGGLWQRSIMLGDKCQPLDFSGVIYYDSNGKQLEEFPMRSPRASPLPSYLYGTPGK